MVSRLVILFAAFCLVLTGCNKTTSGHRTKKVVQLRSSMPAVAPGPPIALQPRLRPAAYRASSIGTAYRLGSGDRLRVIVFGQENLSRIYPVDASGYVSLPLIGAVMARGATTFELEDRIASALRRKYVKDPKVTVEVERHRPFFIMGEVRNAGQYPYVAGMTVQTAVAIAGGFTARAKKSSVQLTRPVNGGTMTRKVPVGSPMQPGDTITVKERFF